jgi:hypothetical protein
LLKLLKRLILRYKTKIPILWGIDMKKQVFIFLAKANKLLLPSYTKKQLDLSKATKLQMAIFGWKVYVTKNALD